MSPGLGCERLALNRLPVEIVSSVRVSWVLDEPNPDCGWRLGLAPAVGDNEIHLNLRFAPLLLPVDKGGDELRSTYASILGSESTIAQQFR